jgi:hypothetical protein
MIALRCEQEDLRVATNAEELGVLRSHLEVVKGKVGNGVLVDNVALVPVVGNLLVALSVPATD